MITPVDPYTEGMTAFKKDKSISKNPYPVGSMANSHWKTGWRTAEHSSKIPSTPMPKLLKKIVQTIAYYDVEVQYLAVDTHKNVSDYKELTVKVHVSHTQYTGFPDSFKVSISEPSNLKPNHIQDITQLALDFVKSL